MQAREAYGVHVENLHRYKPHLMHRRLLLLGVGFWRSSAPTSLYSFALRMYRLHPRSQSWNISKERKRWRWMDQGCFRYTAAAPLANQDNYYERN